MLNPHLSPTIKRDLYHAIQGINEPGYWALSSLGIGLHDNQIEILDAVTNLSIKNLAIIEARGAGKTFSVGVGLVYLAMMIPNLKIGIFGPKADQANRIISEIVEGISKKSNYVRNAIDWERTNKSRLVFHNGSEMVALSADETSMNEGHHFHIVVIDEAHRVSDEAMNQRISPMLGSLPIAKTIKLGITIGRNHFNRSCHNTSSYTVLKRSWDECPILLTTGSFFYKGKEYSQYVFDKMPISVKKELFPDRPDFHTEGELSEIDFQTQYAMEWVEDAYLELKDSDKDLLLSGIHLPLNYGNNSEKYYFGLDTAPGSLTMGKSGLDYTVLSVWRRTSDNRKEKVFTTEWYGNTPNQIQEILNIIHPVYGQFHCQLGLADYSATAYSLVPLLQKQKIPIYGITYAQKERESGKNYKNAIFDEFKFELQNGRCVFPEQQAVQSDPTMNKSLNEWSILERHHGTGLNAKIEAPSGGHDDHPNADALAVFAATKSHLFNMPIADQSKWFIGQINTVPTISSRGNNVKPTTPWNKFHQRGQ